MTIQDIRKYIANEIIGSDHNGIKEGDILNIYAMVYEFYTVTYYEDPEYYLHEENDISLGSDVVLRLKNEVGADYSVGKQYTAPSSHKFMGWKAGKYVGTDTESYTKKLARYVRTQFRCKGHDSKSERNSIFRR